MLIFMAIAEGEGRGGGGGWEKEAGGRQRRRRNSLPSVMWSVIPVTPRRCEMHKISSKTPNPVFYERIMD